MMDSQLKNKLARFEALPPEGTWDKIVAELESSETFAERLFQYEQTPPLRNWTSIEKLLEQPAQPAKMIPFGTRFKRPIRYVAAASIIGTILIISTLFMKRTEAGAIQTGSNLTVPTKPAPVIKKNEPTTVATPQNEQKTLADQLPVSLQQAVAYFVNRASLLPKKTISYIAPQKTFSTVTMQGDFIPAYATKKEAFDFSTSDNYMVYSDEEGHAMKLPKKLFSLVQCKDGDGSCKERIRQLQQKLTSPAITADFSGVLEMLQQLQ